MTLLHWKRKFFTIWTGQAVSLFTTAIVQYAILWYITEQTKSASALSIAGMIAFLPIALFSPFTGSFADRYNRKVIMILSDSAAALGAIVLALAGLFSSLTMPMLYAVLFIRSLGSAFQQPCLHSITPAIVPEGELARCNGYTQTFQSISLVASPALASILFMAMPLWSILLIDVIGAGAAILTLLMAKVPEQPKKKEPLHIFRETAEGFSILKRNRGIFLLVLISGLFSIAYVPTGSLYPLMSMDYFGGTARHAGLVESLFSIGMLVGGLILGAWGGTKNKLTTMLWAMLLMGAALFGIGLLPPTGFVLFAVFTAAAGISAPFFSSLFMTLLQEKIQPEYLGRAIGVSSAVMSLAAPVGLGISGMFAEQIGVSNWFVISGVMTLMCVLLSLAAPSVRNIDKPRPGKKTADSEK